MRFSLVILDDAFDPELCHAAASEWPQPNWPGWNAIYCSEYQKKQACNDWLQMPLSCQRLLQEMLLLNVRNLGLGKLIPDMSLWGGGMHSLSKGGILGLHLDSDHHLQSGLQRVLNGILFLNPEWLSEWGGSLEMWDSERTRLVTQIAPVFNRLVLFTTGDSTWHGVPQALNCPENVQRMTLAVWWYSDRMSGSRRDGARFAEAK